MPRAPQCTQGIPEAALQAGHFGRQAIEARAPAIKSMTPPSADPQFVLSSIVGVARTGNGDKAVLRLVSKTGVVFDLFVPTELQGPLIGAMIEVSQMAFDQRRARSAKDVSEMSRGLLVRAWRFGFNNDWTQLRLQAMTAHGAIELVLPAEKAEEFAVDASELANTFAARKTGVN
jgi:hypothetical protein